MYATLGWTVVAVSRPGYGSTAVGPMSPCDFAPVVDEVRELLGIGAFAATVGTSFGGQQAVQYAAQHPGRTRALILHSAAPSTAPYPDSVAQRLLGPLVFRPPVARIVWRMIATIMRRTPSLGLHLMLSQLSTIPTRSWVPQMSEADRDEVRQLFAAMRSGSGFVCDLAHARAEGAAARRAAQRTVSCPTLVTASRHDRGVRWQHATDFVATIPCARLADLPARSHLFWIGAASGPLLQVVGDFLDDVPTRGAAGTRRRQACSDA